MCMRNDIWRSTFVAASIFFVAGRAACFADDQSKPAAASPAAEPPLVAVSKPVEREVTDSDVFASRIEAAQSVNVVSRATGYLTESNNGTRLYVPGMFARVQLPIGKPHSSLLVMNPALGSDQGALPTSDASAKSRKTSQ
jgi:hypothetical protein